MEEAFRWAFIGMQFLVILVVNNVVVALYKHFFIFNISLINETESCV